MLTEQAEEDGQTGLVPDLQEIRAAARQMLAMVNGGMTGWTDDAPLPDTPSDTIARPEPQSHPSVANGAEHADSESSPALILVVDDNQRNRNMLSRRLERQGYGVVTAQNGRVALEAVRAQPFDLVLLDIMMPDMDGYEVLQRLKCDELLRHIPVIMISALDELDSAVRCIELGAEDYLPKPFDPTILKARTRACLERKRSHDREDRFTKELQESNRRATVLEQMRDDLTNMIVHDLRTPLTSLISGLQTLEMVGDLNESQQEVMGISLSGGYTLLGMINDLLDISKMESGLLRLEYAEVTPTDLTGSALKQVEALANSKDLKLVALVEAGLPRLTADGDMLLRTLVNLLSNAVKFTPPRGVISVTARPGAGGQSIQWSVSDTGEGIPPNAFDRIFEKFGQAEMRIAGRKQSTGLGLTFCKLAVEAHGGRIWVDSVVGKGSTFFFEVPLDPPANMAERAA